MRTWAPLCGGTQMSRSYGCSSNASVMTTLRSASISDTPASSSSLIPFSSKIGVAMSDTLSMVKARLIGERNVSSVLSRSPRSRSSDSIRNATSSGAGGHLYGMPAMPMTILPPVNASSALRSFADASAV